MNDTKNAIVIAKNLDSIKLIFWLQKFEELSIHQNGEGTVEQLICIALKLDKVQWVQLNLQVNLNLTKLRYG